ncbi:hypothetical protein Pfo_021798 [Paulownia fortunei]|nr:hypothetical protein Pfo_021798 [Paulownia fortunei]
MVQKWPFWARYDKFSNPVRGCCFLSYRACIRQA